MQRIVPSIWCRGTADQAAAFYQAVFPGTETVQSTTYPSQDLPDFQREMAGQTLTHELSVNGYRMVLINAGEEFQPTPALSFFVHITDRAELTDVWHKLLDGGTALMDLGEYDFSSYYGWVADRFGVNWQLMLADPEYPRPYIVPNLMFSGPVQNQAAAAVDSYVDLFPDAKLGTRVTYPEGQGPVTEESVVFSDFTLYSEPLSAMDSGVEQPFTFSEGVSLMVNARDQAEIDHLWEALSAVPEAEACGWCKDAYGVSWQIVPENMDELMARDGAYEKLLGMKKLRISEF